MRYVELYKLQNDGSQKVVAVFRLGENDVVFCEGDLVLGNNVEKEGIKDHSQANGGRLFFKDGLKFLEQLRFNFTSGYLNASDLQGF